MTGARPLSEGLRALGVRSGAALLADTYARAATDVLRPGPEAARRTRGQWVRLSAAPSLTALGRRFVDGIGRSL